VLSYELPDQVKPWSDTWFDSLHATSQALQPMQTVKSVKKPIADLGADVFGRYCRRTPVDFSETSLGDFRRRRRKEDFAVKTHF
jgi:hypothetical protein